MSTGGGDNIEVGGISASIELETNELTADLKKAEAALKATGQQIKELEAYIQATGGKVGEFDAALKELNVTKMALVRQVGQLRQEINQEGTAAQAATGQVQALSNSVITLDASAVKAAGGMRSYRMASHNALLVGSDVLTGNVHGLTGHLERLGYGMSTISGLAPIMGAAIGAGLFIAAAGIKQVVEHWDDLRQTFGLESTKTEADHMEELGKKTHKTADETKRLNDYKREQSEIEAMMRLQTSKEKAGGKAGEEALAETGVNEVETALKNAMKREGTYYGADKQSEELKKKKAALEATAKEDMAIHGGSEVSKTTQDMMRPYLDEVKKLEDKIGERTDTRIKQLMNQVIHGTAAEQEAANAKIAGILGKHSDLAPDQAISRLKESSVEGRGKRLEAELQAEQDAALGSDHSGAEFNAPGGTGAQLQSEQDEGVLKDKKAREAHIIAGDVAENRRNLHRQELSDKMFAQTIDEVATDADWDTKTRKGRQGIRGEAAERVKTAEEELPGVGVRAESGIAQARARGASPEQAAEMIGAQVAKALEMAGYDAAEAKHAAKDITEKAGDDVQKKIVKKATDAKDETKASETFKAEDLQNRLQAAAGGEKKKMSLEEESIDLLAKKFKDNGIRFMVKK